LCRPTWSIKPSNYLKAFLTSDLLINGNGTLSPVDPAQQRSSRPPFYTSAG